MSEIEIMARIERRRKWTPAEKAALLAEVEAAGGRVKPVAQRHRIAESVLYNWRAAKKAAAEACAGSSGSVAFVPVGMIGEAGPAMVPSLELSPSRHLGESRAGAIEIILAEGSRVWVDGFVNEAALSRVVRVLKGSR
jgi:transposase